MPAFVKRRVGSLWGTTEEEGTTTTDKLAVCPQIQLKGSSIAIKIYAQLAHSIEAPKNQPALCENITPLRTYCMTILLKEVEESLPDHRGRPLDLFIRHPADSTVREMPKVKSRCCGCARGPGGRKSESRPFSVLVECSKVTQLEPQPSAPAQIAHPPFIYPRTNEQYTNAIRFWLDQYSRRIGLGTCER